MSQHMVYGLNVVFQHMCPTGKALFFRRSSRGIRQSFQLSTSWWHFSPFPQKGPQKDYSCGSCLPFKVISVCKHIFSPSLVSLKIRSKWVSIWLTLLVSRHLLPWLSPSTPSRAPQISYYARGPGLGQLNILHVVLINLEFPGIQSSCELRPVYFDFTRSISPFLNITAPQYCPRYLNCQCNTPGSICICSCGIHGKHLILYFL